MESQMELSDLLPLLIQIFPEYPSAPGGLWEDIKPVIREEASFWSRAPIALVPAPSISNKSSWGRGCQKIHTTYGVDRVGMDSRLGEGSSHRWIPEGNCHCWACRAQAAWGRGKRSSQLQRDNRALAWGAKEHPPMGAGKQESRHQPRSRKAGGAFPIAIAASLQHLPRKHMKLISHAPGCPGRPWSCSIQPRETEDDCYCPSSRNSSHSLMPSVQSQPARSAHPSHCSPHPSLKIPVLSPGFSKASEWPATACWGSGLLQGSLPAAVPRATTAQPAVPAGDTRHGKEGLPRSQEMHLETRTQRAWERG